MLRTRTLTTLLAALLGLALTGCGTDEGPAAEPTPTGSSSGTPTAGASTTADAEPAEADGPLVRLTKVIYNGKPQYEFAYTADGAPKAYEIFHPVTGEPQNSYTVDALDDQGRVIEETVTRHPGGETATISLAYDDSGRLVSQTRHGDSGEVTTTYAYAGPQVTVTSENFKNVYTLDSEGNITKNVSTGGNTTTTTTYLAYDDAPNPFTLTGGMAAQVWSTNNETKWTPDAGCEYTVELSYVDELPATSRAEGCGGIVHDYAYEYATF